MIKKIKFFIIPMFISLVKKLIQIKVKTIIDGNKKKKWRQPLWTSGLSRINVEKGIIRYIKKIDNFKKLKSVYKNLFLKKLTKNIIIPIIEKIVIWNGLETIIQTNK